MPAPAAAEAVAERDDAVLVVDIQGTQSLDHRDRGVARYIRDTSIAIESVDPGAVDVYSLNPDLPLPGGIEALVASGKVRCSDEVAWEDVDLLHVTSPYELSIPIDRILPHGFAGRLVVTLFDLISEVLADHYLVDPGLRRRYRARHELVRQADRILAISRSSAADAVRILELPMERPGTEARIDVVPLAPSPMFRPAPGDAPREPFVLYTGGTDHRKNVEGLLHGWGMVPERLRRGFDLVLACSVRPLERNHFEVMADRLGFGDRLRVTGWISDEELVRLTQTATLVVWPSLYEGYGLPIAEALACDTPVIGANTSSTPELLPAEALFDPSDPARIASALEAALGDRARLERLADHARRWPRRSYADVARETIAAYGRTRTRSVRTSPVRPAPASGRRLAFVTPLPPVPGGVSDYSYRLLEELAAAHPDLVIDAYVDGPPHEREAILAAKSPEGVTARPLATLERHEALVGRYDACVVALGNSEFHTGGLALLRRRRGVTVLAHDVRLTNLHRFAQWQHPDALDGGTFVSALHAMYPGLPAELGEGGDVSADDAERWGVFMARHAVERSQTFLVTSEFARALARLDASPHARDRVQVLPFGVGNVPVASPTATSVRVGPPLLASFGVVNDSKRAPLIADAFASVRETVGDVQLVFVGPVGDDEADRLRAPGIELTGALPDESYLAWLDRAWVAVQLRTTTNGESSAAVGDCLAAGVPTIVSALGAARSLPDDAVQKVPADVDATSLANEIVGLLESVERRTALAAGARRYAAERSFANAAEALYGVLFGAAADGPPPST